MKKKLLILCDFFLPSVKAGGPLRSISAIVDCLKNDFYITIGTRNHELGESKPYLNIVSNQLQEKSGYNIIYFSHESIATGIQSLLKEKNFDIIYFNSFFSPKISVLTLFYLKLHKICARIIISPRGELGIGALSIKQWRKKIFLFLGRMSSFFKPIEFLAASTNEAMDIKRAVGKSSAITVLPNLLYIKMAEKIINHKKTGMLRIIFLSRISKKKNLQGAIEILSLVKGSVHLDIYGVIQEEQYWQDCLHKIRKLPQQVTAQYCGECDPEKVENLLPCYDLFFLPTFNENYGYAIVESLAAGTPVLLSNQTPWHDLSENQAGWTLDLSQPKAFSDKMDELILLDQIEFACYKRGALQYYLNHIAHHSDATKYRLFFEK